VCLLVHHTGLVQLDLQRLDQIHVDACYLSIVVLDLLVLGLMLLDEVFNRLVLFLLDLLDSLLPLGLAGLAQQLHLVLVLQLDFIADALVLFPDARGLLTVFLREGVEVLGLAYLLLLLRDFERSEVLLELTLLYAVLVL
jgi:hypothetical protein